MSKILLSLSGGIDSTTLLAYLLDRRHSVTAVSFKYGSKHNKYENKAARDIASHYGVELIELDISQAMVNIQSSLMLSGDKIPEGHYAGETMKQTVVPARNMIFLSIMAGIAESRKLDGVAIGVHAGDHAIYPDCRPEFIFFMGESIEAATGGQIKYLFAPFVNDDKGAVVQAGMKLDAQIPYHLTRTCYKDQAIACSKCGSCVERLEAFQINGLVDPIEYEENSNV